MEVLNPSLTKEIIYAIGAGPLPSSIARQRLQAMSRDKAIASGIATSSFKAGYDFFSREPSLHRNDRAKLINSTIAAITRTNPFLLHSLNNGFTHPPITQHAVTVTLIVPNTPLSQRYINVVRRALNSAQLHLALVLNPRINNEVLEVTVEVVSGPRTYKVCMFLEEIKRVLQSFIRLNNPSPDISLRYSSEITPEDIPNSVILNLEEDIDDDIPF